MIKRNLLVLMLCLVVSLVLAKELVMNVNSYAPYQILQDEDAFETNFSGINIDIFDLFQKRYPQYKIKYVNYPSARARHILENGSPEIDIHWTSPIFVNEAFLKHNEYTTTVLNSEDIVITMKGSSVVYTKPSDLFGKRVGVLAGYGYGEFDELFASNKITEDRANTHTQNIEKLRRNRIDAYFGNVHVSSYFIRQLGYDVSDFVFSDVSLFKFEYGPFVSKKHTGLINDFRKFIKDIKQSGELQKIIDKYM